MLEAGASGQNRIGCCCCCCLLGNLNRPLRPPYRVPEIFHDSTVYARTQKSSNSLIRFRCSNSCFLLETDIAGHERLFFAKRHPKAEKKLRKRRFFDTADRHEKLYGRSRLYASAQGRHETGGVLSLFSRLSFDISIKNRVQR